VTAPRSRFRSAVAIVAPVLWKDRRQKAPASSRWENLTQDERVERLLWVAAQNIEICKKVLPQLREKRFRICDSEFGLGDPGRYSSDIIPIRDFAAPA